MKSFINKGTFDNFAECLAYVTCIQKVADSNPADAVVNGCTFAENI